MAAHPELDRKTTILLSMQLHDRLTQLAARRGTSMGALIRAAVEAQYGLSDAGSRMEALRALAELDLPVGSPAEMKLESVEQVEDLP